MSQACCVKLMVNIIMDAGYTIVSVQGKAYAQMLADFQVNNLPKLDELMT